ncbi:YihY/virulence factor BrkB family protein [Actinacidiphila acidipaludis]|uniref:YihY/virulence factor BrkB family protein n=1 Tax=Actinacidiphila acidipaludis TaxID=2873382 RepID=A0ABS7QAV5_9ACTN|nr:YihY/virulence factor BrkB family protein [Streptomyces acidipaludis]MBY8880271.1 YihY/virulence factor BrkB family protein [Streptomyces acidipaludis]
MGVVSRLDAYQRSHRWLGQPLAVVYKFFDDQGPYLAALLAYYGFLSLFPLLLLLVTALSGLLHGDPELQERVLHSALNQFPVIGDQIGRNVHSFHSSGAALAVGVAGSVYGVSGVFQAAQNALNNISAVPRCDRLNPLHSRLLGLGFLIVPLVGLIVTTALSTAASVNVVFGVQIGAELAVALNLAAVVIDALLVIAAYHVLTHRIQPLRELVVGAVGAACVWQGVQLGGAYYVNHVLRGATATYGLFGIVLGLFAWIYLGALVFVLGAEVNSVRAEHLWPRSLMTPFTDRVRLTPGDREAYSRYAVTQRMKGFQDVDVTFDEPPGEIGP